MKSLPYDNTIPYLVFFALSGVIMVIADSRDLNDYQNKISALQNAKFNSPDYSDNYDNEEKDTEAQASQWDQISRLNYAIPLENNKPHSTTDAPSQHADNLQNQNISWVPNWASDVKFGQISGVSVDPSGNIAVFHRGDHIWASQSFDKNDKYVDNTRGPIKQDTIVLLDKTGKVILQWGRNMFYLPHGLTIDHEGNYWITDVALHQVYKFSIADIQTHLKELKEAVFEDTNTHSNSRNDKSPALFQNSIIKPALTLGQAFEPGNDHVHFCKPTAVAVRKNGDFFVSDGYCNSRIVKFDKNGNLIAEWGRRWTDTDFAYAPPPHNAFWVPHGLSLADELDFLYLADRENGRVLCFFASNGTFHKEYKHPDIVGSKIYSVAYNQERIYLINGPDPLERSFHIKGYVIDIHSGNIISQFEPHKDMTRPHDIAITPDGTEIYVVELDIHIVYKFIQGVNGYTKLGNSTVFSGSDHQPVSLTDTNSKDNKSTENTTTAVLVLSLITTIVIFIALCLSIAAIVARCQKRGRMKDYDEASVEFTKLVE